MPKLIGQDTYDETIELIRGQKTPDDILKKMQVWYSDKGITLYNLYFENSYKEGKLIGKSLKSLTNKDENDESIPYLEADALLYYMEIMKEAGEKEADIKKLANFQRLNKGIYGYDFKKIWQEEIIFEAGKEICPEIERRYKESGVKKVVNEKNCSYTVYTSDAGMDDNTKNMIELDITDQLLFYDKEKVIDNPYGVVKFGAYSSLINKYSASIYY